MAGCAQACLRACTASQPAGTTCTNQRTHPPTHPAHPIHPPLASQRRRSCSSVAPTVTADGSRAGLVSHASMSSLPAADHCRHGNQQVVCSLQGHMALEDTKGAAAYFWPSTHAQAIRQSAALRPPHDSDPNILSVCMQEEQTGRQLPAATTTWMPAWVTARTASSSCSCTSPAGDATQGRQALEVVERAAGLGAVTR